MGSEDHLFLPSVGRLVSEHDSAELFVVENCGHVVNVEQPSIFNRETINFLKSL